MDPIIIPVEIDLSGLEAFGSEVSDRVDAVGRDVARNLGAGFDAAKTKAQQAMGVASKAIDKVGAVATSVAGKVQAFGGHLAGVGKAAGVGAVGLGFLVAGAIKLTTAAAESLKNLEALGATAFVTTSQIAAAHEAADAITGIGTGADIATVALGAAFAPAIDKASRALINVELFVAKVANAFDVGAISINSWSAVLSSLVLGPLKMYVDGMDMVLTATLGASEGRSKLVASFDAFAISATESAFAVHTETQEMIDAITVNEDAAGVIKVVTAARVADTAAAKARAAAVKKAEEDMIAAEKKRADAVAAIFSAGDERMAEERFQAEIAAHKRILDLKKLLVDETVKQRDAEAEALAAVEETQSVLTGTADALTDAFTGVAGAIGQLLDGEIARYGAVGEAGEKAAKRAWKVSQGLAVAQTLVAGAVAAMQALAQLGPVAGPIAAAGIVLTAEATSLATIKQAAPEFDTGTGNAQATRGQTDQFLATLYRGEGVLTRAGVERAGGEHAVNALNNGTTPSGGAAGPLQVSVLFRDRVVDHMVSTVAKSGGALSRVLDSIAPPLGVARVWR